MCMIPGLSFQELSLVTKQNSGWGAASLPTTRTQARTWAQAADLEARVRVWRTRWGRRSLGCCPTTPALADGPRVCTRARPMREEARQSKGDGGAGQRDPHTCYRPPGSASAGGLGGTVPDRGPASPSKGSGSGQHRLPGREPLWWGDTEEGLSPLVSPRG